MNVMLTQHPVGQGGMMSGLLEISGGRFHWIYDCGSNQYDALKREIAVVKARGPVDCLFISHLDSDHINGIDALLSAVSVGEVVLPYLNEIDRLVAFGHDSATGALNGNFLSMLDDTQRWFSSRGVMRITYVNPRNDESEEDDGPDRPEGGDGEGEITVKWSRKGTRIRNVRQQHPGSFKAPVVQRMQTSASMLLKVGNKQLDWLLAPYAHRPSDKSLAAFKCELHTKFNGTRVGANVLQTVLSHKNERDKLRTCYELIWSDHNLVSMALYAGVTRSAKWQLHLSGRHLWHLRDEPEAPVAWLGTGDMHLNIGRRRKAFLSHYGSLLHLVNVFSLPHHGSHRNFDHSLLNCVPNVTQFVASAGPNSYGHPDRGVKRQVQSTGKDFVRVSEKQRSVLQWKHQR